MLVMPPAKAKRKDHQRYWDPALVADSNTSAPLSWSWPARKSSDDRLWRCRSAAVEKEMLSFDVYLR